jgi:MoxR-like ATPase
MEERQATIDGKEHKMAAPFLVVATQNPIEHEGTYRLPEAQLDRFIFKIEMTYPSLEDEIKILTEFHERKQKNDLATITPVLNARQIESFREKVNEVHIEPKIIEYIAQISHQTRESKDLYLGASPRASLAIMTTAKAIAAMRGRDFVTPEDVKFVINPALRHRIILTPEKEMEGAHPDEVINEIVQIVEIPR